MALKPMGYRPWNGRRRGPALRFWPIARQGIALVLRRKVYWIFLFFSLMGFLMNSTVIYLQAQVEGVLGQRIPPGARRNFLFTGTGEAYLRFLDQQGAVVMIMLALAGSILVGNDFRAGALPFYLSKPIGKLEYFLGKFLAVAGLAALITVLPAVVLFIEYGAFTESFSYYLENLHILRSILLSGALFCVVPAAVLLGLASLLKSTVPILLAWAGIFFFIPRAVAILHKVQSELGSDSWGWLLLDLWSEDLDWIAEAIFGIEKEATAGRWPWGAAVVAGVVLASVLVFWRRISAVEVVK